MVKTYTPTMGEDPVLVCEHALADVKGQNIVHLNLEGKGAYADHIFVATGTSDRHVQSLADRVAEYLRKSGHVILGVEGASGSPWVLVDAGGIVVHVFTEEAREMYNIEKIYAHEFKE